MNRLLLPVCVMLSSLAAALPASAELREVSGFDQVAVEGRFRVEVTVGPEYRVYADGPDASRIQTVVEDDTLEIRPARRPWFGGNPQYDATVRVTLPRLESVTAARGASVRATAGGECDRFGAAAAMGSALTVNGLQCDMIEAAAAMGANLTLAGACESLDVAAAMGAVVEAAELRCGSVDASAAMGADIEAFASAAFDASASMGGSINVAGGATSGDRSAVMGGSITQN